MVQLDISGLSYFMPIFGFMFVFLIVYSVLAKTKILGEEKWINVFVGFIVAIIFAIMTPSREYVQTVIPWFAVLIVSLFLILVLVGLSQSKIDAIMKPWFVWVFIVVLILIFLISAINVFPFTFSAFWGNVTGFVTTQAKVTGAIILLIVAALTAWRITSK
ncbi:hypothetical protein HYW76_02310 [Candidatus Pacearchaeota archaeon]|nr:hypothetical protein [Candidatus Pacearchaeota archaeon]